MVEIESLKSDVRFLELALGTLIVGLNGMRVKISFFGTELNSNHYLEN